MCKFGFILDGAVYDVEIDSNEKGEATYTLGKVTEAWKVTLTAWGHTASSLLNHIITFDALIKMEENKILLEKVGIMPEQRRELDDNLINLAHGML